MALRELATLVPVQEQFLEQAQALLRSVPPQAGLRWAPADALRDKLGAQRSQQPRIRWLVASPRGSMSGTVPASAPPTDLSVTGSDAPLVYRARQAQLLALLRAESCSISM